MDVSEIGEFGLIARLREALGAPSDERLIVGMGDDAAVWRSGDGYTIATTDTMVAGVHFLAETDDWRGVGWKALAANVSDIAAMGGAPAFALVTLCLPRSADVACVDALYAGMRECAEACGITVAGGDIVSAAAIAVTVALTGTAGALPDGAPAILRRDAARVGDAVAVSGALGASAGGLRALTKGMPRAEGVGRLIERHTRPQPRMALGAAAVACGVRCAIDVSDGLVQDLAHLCESSGLDAELWLDKLPIDGDLIAVYPDDATLLAASGGEDYELLLAAPEETLRALASQADVPLTVVGRVLPRAGDAPRVRTLDAQRREVALAPAGWDHLARRR